MPKPLTKVKSPMGGHVARGTRFTPEEKNKAYLAYRETRSLSATSRLWASS